MSICIDPEALLDSRRVLLRHELALTSVSVATPRTGETSDLTEAALDRIATIVGALTADLHGLADGLAGLLDDLQHSEDGVTAWLDLLRLRSLV